jgi:hypothetical protein
LLLVVAMSTLRGRRISRLQLHVPWSGGWLAHVTLDVGALPAPGAAELKVADLTMQGAVLPANLGFDGPDQPSCVVAGGAGWQNLLALRGEYSSPTGVLLSTVLRDVAAISGEPYDAPAEQLLGTAYGWSAATASAPREARSVLDDLVARGALPTWRVPPSGRTSFAPWPSIGAADGAVRVTSRGHYVGVRYVALDTRAAILLPGATLEGSTIRRTIYLDRAGALTAEAWS